MVFRVSVEAAPAYELVLSMASPRTLAKVAGPRLMARLTTLGHGSDYFWAHLLSAALEAPPPRDGEAFLAHLEAIDARDLRLRLAGAGAAAAGASGGSGSPAGPGDECQCPRSDRHRGAS